MILNNKSMKASSNIKNKKTIAFSIKIITKNKLLKMKIAFKIVLQFQMNLLKNHLKALFYNKKMTQFKKKILN